MTFMATPTDVITLVRTARKLDGNPFSLAGKLVGLGAEEQKVGIPVWAWLTVGLGIGVALGFKFAPVVNRRSRRIVAFE